MHNVHFTLLGKPGQEQGVSAGLPGMTFFSPAVPCVQTEGINYCRTNSTSSSLHTADKGILQNQLLAHQLSTAKDTK